MTYPTFILYAGIPRWMAKRNMDARDNTADEPLCLRLITIWWNFAPVTPELGAFALGGLHVGLCHEFRADVSFVYKSLP